MNPLDDLFREGLGDRKPDVPEDLWRKIADRKTPVPEGEDLDRLFAGALSDRRAVVPAGMWARITAARKTFPILRYAAVLLLLMTAFATYLFWAGPQVQGPGEESNIAVPTPMVITENEMSAPGEPVKRPTEASSLPVNVREVAPAVASLESETPGAPIAISDRAVTAIVKQAKVTSEIPYVSFSPEFGDRPDAPVTAIVPADRSFRRSSRDRWQAEILVGAAYSHQTFGLQQADATAHREAREVSEFPEVSFQVSARFDYLLGQHLSLISGITYVEIRNQLEYEEANGNGGKDLIRRNNSLRMLELPLLLRYRLTSNRLRLGLNAGPIVNLYTSASGQYLHPDSASPLPLNNEGEYRNNVGLGWTASITTTYVVGKKRTTRLLLEPFFKHYPGSFTTTAAPLSEHYWMAGLQLGLRKQF